jgi:hypothetical protein
MNVVTQGGITSMLKTVRKTLAYGVATALALSIVSSAPTGALAAEADAKDLLKAMSNYLSQQKAISFDYDTNLEVVTKEHQKLLLASSGKIEMGRPDKIRATRFGGFANVEMVFD